MRFAPFALVTIAALARVALAADIALAPGDDLAAAAADAPVGASFHLAAGIYRLQSIVPRDGQRFVGDPGAVLCGARLLTTFTRQGALWMADGQTQQGQVYGTTLPGFAGGAYPEDLYLDDRPLRHVLDPALVVAGAWWFDYPNHRVLMADDPTGHVVEVGVTRLAFWGTAANVSITGLTIEKYANQPQVGAIGGQFHGSGWTVQGCVVRLNHGLGIAMGDSWRVLSCHAIDNGQLGIGGNGGGLLVDGCEIARNNYAHIDPGWEAGGTKWALTTGLVVRNCWCHDNDGPGLWTDTDNLDALIEDNRVEGNANEGIVHEIGYHATIRGNTVTNNGWRDAAQRGWLWNAAIGVHASADTEVCFNHLGGNRNGIVGIQQARGSGAYGPHLLQNLWVHDNDVVQETVPADGSASASGIVQDVGDLRVFTGRNNRWTGDAYWLGANPTPFCWLDAWRTESEWRGFGEDVDGMFSRQPRPIGATPVGPTTTDGSAPPAAAGSPSSPSGHGRCGHGAALVGIGLVACCGGRARQRRARQRAGAAAPV